MESAQEELNKKGMAELGLQEEALNYQKAEEAAQRLKKLLVMSYPTDFTKSLGYCPHQNLKGASDHVLAISVQFCRSITAEIPKVSSAATQV